LPLLALLLELAALTAVLALLREAALAVLALAVEALAELARDTVVLAPDALAVDFTGVSLGAVALPATTSLKPCPARDLGGLHLDRRAAARVAGGAGLAVLPLEGPEADQRHALALLDGDLGVLDQAAEHLVDVGPSHLRVLLDRVDEFLAVQGRLLAQ
jgi:hypothetical protein